MTERIIPSLVPGLGTSLRSSRPGRGPGTPHPDGGGSDTGEFGDDRFLGPRELDLRRTPAPDPGGLPVVRTRHLRRYAVAVFDDKGRISDRALFAVLGWSAGTRVDIAVHDGGALVVRHDRRGGHVLTGRVKIAVPAGLRRWCGFGEREQVLLVAVPSLSALVVHGVEKLDRALPDVRRVVADAHRPGERPPAASSEAASSAAAASSESSPVAPSVSGRARPGRGGVSAAGGGDGD